MKTVPSGGWGRQLAPLLMTVASGLMHDAQAQSTHICAPGLQALSAQQRNKFTLVQQDCAGFADSAASVGVVADATQLTNADPVPSSPLIVGDPRAADLLSMYDLAEQRRAKGNVTPSGARALQLAPQVDAAASRHDIDPLLLHAIAFVESRHNANAVSQAGALGLMQVMPATGRRFGVASPTMLHQPATNLDVSATYLKTLQERFGNDLALILAAYNAGEGAVERYGRRVPPYAETRDYVQKVLDQYEALRRAAARLTRTPRAPA
jgi:soluble lytic murein transglycosylase-like protein